MSEIVMQLSNFAMARRGGFVSFPAVYGKEMIAMVVNRRTILKNAIGATTLLSAPFLMRTAALGSDPIRVGVLLDLSGPLEVLGRPKVNCIQLAAETLNAAGGVLGREVELKIYDTQSDNQLYAQYAQQSALRDRVAVVHGGITSAAREIVRPILSRAQTLYFYNMIYEGGLCDRNTFVTGPTPPQLLAKLIPYMIEKFGPRIYTVAADYNFGHDSAASAASIAAQHGGEIVGEEFFPLDANDFSATIGRIQQAKADSVFNIFISPPQEAFYGQWAAAGLSGKIGLAGHAFGDSGEVRRLPANVVEGITVAKNYLDEIDTPANAAFRARYKERFPDEAVIGTLGPTDYQGMMLWAAGVEKAGDTARERVVEALETGLSIDGPSGGVTVDPATHHCILDVYLAEVREGRFAIQEHWAAQRPVENDDSCNLTAG
ncbi:ABC transporter substrate-binding protein [Nitratireductor sp. StC3]|uniref:ABC transporter substrate-binding protein n=1 Tax=Nitratireductor sp. StC3 TaxID=2126741 RepID=UPI0018EB6E2F|nr:ABC transporter substrate-binding protein [Nitratireductor sp. StC3]